MLEFWEVFSASPRDWTYICPRPRIKRHPHYDALGTRETEMGSGSRWSKRGREGSYSTRAAPPGKKGTRVTFRDKSAANPSREEPRNLPECEAGLGRSQAIPPKWDAFLWQSAASPSGSPGLVASENCSCWPTGVLPEPSAAINTSYELSLVCTGT